MFDVMMEGKSKDISLLKLRPDLLRFAPDVAARFRIMSDDALDLAADEMKLAAGDDVDQAHDVDEGGI